MMNIALSSKVGIRANAVQLRVASASSRKLLTPNCSFDLRALGALALESWNQNVARLLMSANDRLAGRRPVMTRVFERREPILSPRKTELVSCFHGRYVALHLDGCHRPALRFSES